jgi:hypothetical protein
MTATDNSSSGYDLIQEAEEEISSIIEGVKRDRESLLLEAYERRNPESRLAFVAALIGRECVRVARAAHSDAL